jgi:hypothetical protein
VKQRELFVIVCYIAMFFSEYLHDFMIKFKYCHALLCCNCYLNLIMKILRVR